MKKIGLYSPDSGIPNYAIMKIYRYHKSIGDRVAWYTPIESSLFDKVYCSQIFTFSPRPNVLNENAEFGGTGIDIQKTLPDYIENLEPDYSLYPDFSHGLGFLTRGCIRTCSFCVVPQKEGLPSNYRDIEEILQGRKSAVLMDNNILSSEYGIKQIEKIIELGIKVDFNQGMDARLIDQPMAKLLSKVKWLKPIRMACDSIGTMKAIGRATELLRWYNLTPRKFFVYVLVKDIPTAIDRIRYLKGLDLDPFAQPYRDLYSDKEPASILKDFSRWVNHKAIFRSMTWNDYKRLKKINDHSAL